MLVVHADDIAPDHQEEDIPEEEEDDEEPVSPAKEKMTGTERGRKPSTAKRPRNTNRVHLHRSKLLKMIHPGVPAHLKAV